MPTVRLASYVFYVVKKFLHFFVVLLAGGRLDTAAKVYAVSAHFDGFDGVFRGYTAGEEDSRLEPSYQVPVEFVSGSAILFRVKRVEKDRINAETSFVNDLGADSLDTVELVMELEEEFDTNIPDDAAEKIQTVGQAVEYIDANASG